LDAQHFLAVRFLGGHCGWLRRDRRRGCVGTRRGRTAEPIQVAAAVLHDETTTAQSKTTLPYRGNPTWVRIIYLSEPLEAWHRCLPIRYNFLASRFRHSG